jgi:preprotein translocase subunit SecD
MVACSLQNNTSLQSSNLRKEFEEIGGFRAVFSMDKQNGNQITSEQIEATKDILSYRLEQMGIVKRIITSSDTRNITVEFIYDKNLDLNRIQSIIDIASRKGYLSFQEIDENKKDMNGVYIQTDKVILDGGEISRIEVSDSNNGKVDILIELDKDISRIFEETTGKLIGKKIGIFMDNELISAPMISASISGGKFAIPSQFTKEDAINFAIMVRSGDLPVGLIQTNIESVPKQ